jgi:protocatechuate 3,4-dioxygenase beta subunit
MSSSAADLLRRLRLTRRVALRAGLTVPLPLALAACFGRGPDAGTATPSTSGGAAAPSTAAGTRAATPACHDGDEQSTIAETEGPYFTPGSPQRTSLVEAGMPGTRLAVSGSVLTTGCQPVARALLDFWQADDGGAYDNQGYRLRGHQFTDDQGRYRLETIVPGLYPGRTRHIHVKVQAPRQPVLTTQLYFPGEPRNADDGLFRSELQVDLHDAAQGRTGDFDFVLDVT